MRESRVQLGTPGGVFGDPPSVDIVLPPSAPASVPESVPLLPSRFVAPSCPASLVPCGT